MSYDISSGFNLACGCFLFILVLLAILVFWLPVGCAVLSVVGGDYGY